MEAFVVRGGRKLEGTMRVDGAKTRRCPFSAASVLTEETVVLQGVPMISDVRKMTDILTMLGCRIRRDGHTLTLDAGRAEPHENAGRSLQADSIVHLPARADSLALPAGDGYISRRLRNRTAPH